MKIGIDAFACNHGKSGNGSYLFSIVKNLPETEKYKFELFGSEFDRFIYTDESKIGYKSIKTLDGIGAERLWHKWNSARFVKKQQYDAVLYTAGAKVLPGKINIPSIAVINDVITDLYPKSSINSRVLKSLARVDRIIAPTEFIKKSLTEIGVPESKIKVIYNGIDHSIFHPAIVESVETDVVNISPFAIKKPYIIYASSMQSEKKKHIELIKAFELFKKRTGLKHRLVIAGSDGPFSDQIHRMAYKSEYASDIFITGYFPHENFPDFYRNSEACIFPFVNEGVGLSVLEAMATGIPTACSMSGALPEITGKNTILFNSDNIEEMSLCIEKLISGTKEIKDYVKNGLAWTKQFTWEKTVSETLSLIDSIV